MTWKDFKKSAEASNGKPCKSLGLCEISFGCLRGSPYIEIIPIKSRVDSKNGVDGIIVELHENYDSVLQPHVKKSIMKLADNAREINNVKNIKEALEDLFKKRQAKANAIKSLEI